VTDPFSPEADPMPSQTEARLSRRPVVVALAVLPAALAASGCAHPAPACPTQPGDGERCRHRFCRYYAAGRGP
jgi:hypothetical protein